MGPRIGVGRMVSPSCNNAFVRRPLPSPGAAGLFPVMGIGCVGAISGLEKAETSPSLRRIVRAVLGRGASRFCGLKNWRERTAPFGPRRVLVGGGW